MKRTIIIGMTASLFTACGIYKPYTRPDMAVETHYRDVETTDTVTIASLSWRELFADEKLQALIARGLERNTDLQIARLRVKEAEAVLKNAVRIAEGRRRHQPLRRKCDEELQSRRFGELGNRPLRQTDQCQARSACGPRRKSGLRAGCTDTARSDCCRILLHFADARLPVRDRRTDIGELAAEYSGNGIAETGRKIERCSHIAGACQPPDARIVGACYSEKYPRNGKCALCVACYAGRNHRAWNAGWTAVFRGAVRRRAVAVAGEPSRRKAGGI